MRPVTKIRPPVHFLTIGLLTVGEAVVDTASVVDASSIAVVVEASSVAVVVVDSVVAGASVLDGASTDGEGCPVIDQQCLSMAVGVPSYLYRRCQTSGQRPALRLLCTSG